MHSKYIGFLYILLVPNRNQFVCYKRDQYNSFRKQLSRSMKMKRSNWRYQLELMTSTWPCSNQYFCQPVFFLKKKRQTENLIQLATTNNLSVSVWQNWPVLRCHLSNLSFLVFLLTPTIHEELIEIDFKESLIHMEAFIQVLIDKKKNIYEYFLYSYFATVLSSYFLNS